MPNSRLASQQWPKARGPQATALPALEVVRTFRAPHQISPANAALLAVLDRWMHEPDDLGDEWWSAFEKELEENHTFKERDIG